MFVIIFSAMTYLLVFTIRFASKYIVFINAGFLHTLFTISQIIRLHCIYKYVCLLRKPKYLSSTSVYSLPDYHTSLYIKMCLFIAKAFNIITHICLLSSRLLNFTIYQICSFIAKSFNIIIHFCSLSSRLSDFTVYTNMFVHYEILQYYPPHMFIFFHTIRLHYIYKYVHSLRKPSILSFTCVYSHQTSLYIQICSLIIKFFNILSPLFVHCFSYFQNLLYNLYKLFTLPNSSILYTPIIN